MSTKQLVRFYDSVLMHEAQRALARAQEARSSGDACGHGGASFTAVVAATSATETYLSEVLAHLEEKKVIKQAERDEIRRKEGLWTKYNALAKKFGGDLSRHATYDPFVALVRLRNSMVHRSAEYLEPGVWPPKVAPYKDLIPHATGDGLDWTSQVFDAQTAEWAVNTARKFLVAVDDYMPDPARRPFVDPGAS